MITVTQIEEFTQYTLIDKDPLGFIWMSYTEFEGKKIGLLKYAYLLPQARGKKLFEPLLARVMVDCDLIVTGAQTKDGENKMKKLGFLFDEKTNLWVLNFKEK